MARYVSKEFLSPCAHETGSIVCQIETPLTKNIDQYVVESPWMHGSIKVMDCSKSVVLDFDVHDQPSYEKRLAKLDKMVEELQNMRHQFVNMWENNLRNVEHKKRSLAQEVIDKAAARALADSNYRGRVR